ncbi:hypothetical protein NC651_010114 [Populus alba x Populus x berolinensis]|nr:hypothetical protein NC651_010114 [Populus alba x Populus x berolinensis]
MKITLKFTYITSKSNFAGVFAIRGIVKAVADFGIEKERGDKVTEPSIRFGAGPGSAHIGWARPNPPARSLAQTSDRLARRLMHARLRCWTAALVRLLFLLSLLCPPVLSSLDFSVSGDERARKYWDCVYASTTEIMGKRRGPRSDLLRIISSPVESGASLLKREWRRRTTVSRNGPIHLETNTNPEQQDLNLPAVAKDSSNGSNNIESQDAEFCKKKYSREKDQASPSSKEFFLSECEEVPLINQEVWRLQSPLPIQILSPFYQYRF